MSVLIVYCHPSNTSYNYQILQKIVKKFKEEGITYILSDLYKMNFKTDMSKQEYFRESKADISLPIAEDVRIEQDKINASKAIIFLYPLWWSDYPAKLKGWIDRVFTVGFAYKNTNSLNAMKTLEYAVSICTAGHSNQYLDQSGISKSIENIIINDRFGNRFKNKEVVILGNCNNLDQTKEAHIKSINNICKKIKTLAI